MSYSQHGEDLIIAKMFRANPKNPNSEICPQLNCLRSVLYELTEISNSRLLIERGWDATLIEFSLDAGKRPGESLRGNDACA